MIDAKHIHKSITENGHEWHISLNTWRIPTLDEVEKRIKSLKEISAKTGNDVRSGGITVYFNDGLLLVNYSFLERGWKK